MLDAGGGVFWLMICSSSSAVRVCCSVLSGSFLSSTAWSYILGARLGRTARCQEGVFCHAPRHFTRAQQTTNNKQPQQQLLSSSSYIHTYLPPPLPSPPLLSFPHLFKSPHVPRSHLCADPRGRVAGDRRRGKHPPHVRRVRLHAPGQAPRADGRVPPGRRHEGAVDDVVHDAAGDVDASPRGLRPHAALFFPPLPVDYVQKKGEERG